MTGSFAYGRLSWDFCCCSSTCLFTSRPISIQILPLLWMVHNIVHSPASLVREDRHAAVILQWEGSGDHLPHKMTRANKKHYSLVTHTVGYFTEITGVDASCGYLDDLWHKNMSQTTRCTVRCFGNILHPYNTLICYWRPDHSIFGTVQPCTRAGCPVIP